MQALLETSRTYTRTPFTAWNMLPAPALTFWNTGGLGRGGPKEGTSSRAVTDTCGAKRSVIPVDAAAAQECPSPGVSQCRMGDAQPSPGPESEGTYQSSFPAIPPALVRGSTIPSFSWFLPIHSVFICVSLRNQNSDRVYATCP